MQWSVCRFSVWICCVCVWLKAENFKDSSVKTASMHPCRVNLTPTCSSPPVHLHINTTGQQFTLIFKTCRLSRSKDQNICLVIPPSSYSCSGTLPALLCSVVCGLFTAGGGGPIGLLSLDRLQTNEALKAASLASVTAAVLVNRLQCSNFNDN